jgi:hypothetical protein
MPEYRCYFFGTGASVFGAPRVVEAAENLRADTDEQARLLAETVYRRRRNHVHGFELWQADRLVHQTNADITSEAGGIDALTTKR